MDTEMEDALRKLIDSIRDHGQIRVETGKMKNEVDKRKRVIEKMEKEILEKEEQLDRKREELNKTREVFCKQREEVEAKREELLRKKEKRMKRTELLLREKEKLANIEEAIKTALEELMKTNMNTETAKKEKETLQKDMEILQKEIEKLQKEMDTLQKETEKLQKEMEKMQNEHMLKKTGSFKRKEELSKNRKGIEQLQQERVNKNKEFEELQKEMEKLQTKMKKLQKEVDNLQAEQVEAMEVFSKMRENRAKTHKEIEELNNGETEQMEKEIEEMEKEIQKMEEERDTNEEFKKNQEEIIRLGKEVEKIERKTDKKRSELVEMHSQVAMSQNEIIRKQCELEKSVFEFKALKIWQFDFIDDQIKSRLESGLTVICSADVVSDILDDIRLLVFEQKGRGCGNEMLSVHKLCTDPIVKIISTKKNIQKSFIESAKVLNLDKVDKKKSEKIRDDSKVLRLPGSLVDTAVLEVLNFPDSFPDFAKIFVKITDEVESSYSVDYQVVLKSEEKWERIPTELQEGYIRCPPRPRMKYLFVVSRGKWRQDTLTPEGLDWKAVDDKNVSVKYPPWSVSTKCEIRTQVMHPNPVEQAKSEESQDDIDIESVSPCLWIKADNITKFQKPAIVTLPCPSSPSTTKKTQLCLVEFTDDDDMHISERIFRVTPLFCEFEIDHPIRTAVVSFKRQITKKSKRWKREVKQHYPNLNKECIIVVFSALYVENTIWVEIVQPNRVEHLIALKSEQSLVQIKNARSKPLPLRYGDAIRVHAQTGIKIPQRYTGDYMQIKFSVKDDENNLTFGVDIMDKASSAELAFWLQEKQVYVCRFNTDELLKGRRGTSNPEPTIESTTQEHIFFLKHKTLCYRSLGVLAHQIPVDKVLFLAIGLGMSTNDVDHLKAKGYTGRDLTLNVLIAWREKCVHDFIEMINQLEEVLQENDLNDIASTLKEASKVKRSLKTKDFAE